MFEIYEAAQIDDSALSEYCEQIEEWSCGLWWGDFEEAGIERLYIAFDENDVPCGYQSINSDGATIAIEIHSDYQGKGLSRLLIEESGSYKPERNENPEFWEAVASW